MYKLQRAKKIQHEDLLADQKELRRKNFALACAEVEEPYEPYFGPSVVDDLSKANPKIEKDDVKYNINVVNSIHRLDLICLCDPEDQDGVEGALQNLDNGNFFNKNLQD